MSVNQANAYLLAADNSPNLIPLLRSDPALASSQDEHGYSLIHAAASYNHLELLRTLVNEFHVNVDLMDEDGETALFVVETVECAKVLVEELHADITVRGEEGQTARERISEENDFPQVAVYLRTIELERQVNGVTEDTTRAPDVVYAPAPLPEGVTIDIGMAPEDAGEVVDTEFRQRIEDLASREDFQGDSGQDALRELITEAIRGNVGGQDRDVRQRTN